MRSAALKTCALAIALVLCLGGAAMSAPAKHAPKGAKCRAGKAHRPKPGSKAKKRRCARTARHLITDDSLKPQEVKVTPAPGSDHESGPPSGKRAPVPVEEPPVGEETPVAEETPASVEEAPAVEEVPAPEEEAPPAEELPAPEEEAPSTEGGEAEAPPPVSELGPQLPDRFFSPTSFWNTPVPASAPVASDSEAVVGALVATVEKELVAKTGPAINTTKYSVPIYTVPPDQPDVEVQLDSPYSAPGLREALAAVPLPPAAQPAWGNDRHLVVWQPSSDRLWEFWHLENTASGWRTGWGGAIQNVFANSGSYDSGAWPGGTLMWGASASSLSIAGGLITFHDLETGTIDHALSMSLPEVRAATYFLPAHRTDGESTDPLSLPEGAHLRLDPNLDLSTLNLPPLTLAMAEAAQKYGIFIRDIAGNVAFNAQDPVGLPENPYLGPGGYFEGSYPRKLLTPFPWGQLELLVPPTS